MSEGGTFKLKGLDQLIRSLEGELPKIKIGILGGRTARTSPGGGHTETNASIGMKHEFGEDGMPVRSFLRMPIGTKLDEAMQKSKMFDDVAFKEVIRSGSILVWAQKVGIIAEQVVAEAFDTGGFGQWKQSNMAAKKTKQTLVETQQLRNSIASEVVE